MSDHDGAPDPMDKAYVEAEAVLSDDSARSARRARVLAAIAAQPAAAPAASPRGSAWRNSSWLAAASITAVVVGVFVTSQIYQPTPPQTQTAPPAPAASAAAPPAAATATTPTAGVPPAGVASAPRQSPAAPTSAARENAASPEPPVASAAQAGGAVAIAPRALTQVPEAPAVDRAPAPPPPSPEAPIVAAAPKAFPAPPPAPPADGVAASVQTENRLESLSRGASDEAARDSPRAAARRGAIAAFAAPSADALGKSAPSAGLKLDQAEQLRAAAAAGRTAEVARLLDQGAPIDAPDAAGDTALMKSIEAVHAAAAAVLRRHGASLDHRNHAGESARDMATSKGDADLNQALGLSR